MQRSFEHTAYTRRPFDTICRLLAADPHSVFAAASDIVVKYTNDLVMNVDAEMRFFSVHEEVRIEILRFQKTSPTNAFLDFTWTADRHRRLLPSIDARLTLDPLIPRGQGATTRLTLAGEFLPPKGLFATIEEAVVGRNIIDAAIVRFLDELARSLTDR